MQKNACPLCGQSVDELPVTILPERGMVVANGGFAILTGKEASVLAALADAFPKHLTKDRILDLVYGELDEPEIKIVDVFICKIRKKVAPIGVHIDTFWGSGYALALPMKVTHEAAE